MDIIYSAIVLNIESIRKLLHAFPVEHPRIHCHHMTLKYGDNVLPENLGEEVEMIVMGSATDDKCQVAVIDWLLAEERFAHITISCAERVSPVYAKEMLIPDKKNARDANG